MIDFQYLTKESPFKWTEFYHAYAQKHKLRKRFLPTFEMVKLFVYTALFSVLFSLYTQLHVCIRYAMNQSYYSEVLCENKAVKNSCCKGKCAVQKELSDLGKKETPQPGRSNPAALKISKAEEAIPARFIFFSCTSLLSVIQTPFVAGNGTEHPSVLLRPPGGRSLSCC